MGTLAWTLPVDNLLFILKFFFIIALYIFIAYLFLGRRKDRQRGFTKKPARSSYHLTIESGAEALDMPGDHLYYLSERLTLGRDEGNDIQLHDATASGTHCVVFQEGSVILVEDLGSKNGTLVNGEKISGRYELKIGDTIQVGMVTLCLKGGS